MARVILFNPPDPAGRGYTREGRCTQEAGVWATQWPPVSLATTAALLEKDGHELTVMDFPAMGLNAASLMKTIKRNQPDFAIWNTATPTLKADLILGRMIKDMIPETTTGVMGTHVSVLPEETLNLPFIDVVIRREPEQPIRNLCRVKSSEWASIEGISYRDSEGGEIRHNPDAEFLRSEKIPYPAWHLLDIKPYRLPLKGKPFLIVAPIRGCPYPCNFCTAPVYYGKRLRKRPVKQVVNEIQDNITRYGVRDFFIWADTFTADKAYVGRLCREIITRRLPISWACNSRVDTVEREMLVLMKEAGLWMISYGLESGNNEILKCTGKRITAEQSRAAVTTARQLGIKTSGHFIFGLPGETEATMKQTLSLALDLPLDIAQFYTAAPFPGTGLYRQALAEGWLKAGSAFSQSHTVMDLPELPAIKVEAFRRYAYKRFYTRTRPILNLVSMVRPSMIKNISFNLIRFFRWILGSKR